MGHLRHFLHAKPGHSKSCPHVKYMFIPPLLAAINFILHTKTSRLQRGEGVARAVFLQSLYSSNYLASLSILLGSWTRLLLLCIVFYTDSSDDYGVWVCVCVVVQFARLYWFS